MRNIEWPIMIMMDIGHHMMAPLPLPCRHSLAPLLPRSRTCIHRGNATVSNLSSSPPWSAWTWCRSWTAPLPPLSLSELSCELCPPVSRRAARWGSRNDWSSTTLRTTQPSSHHQEHYLPNLLSIHLPIIFSTLFSRCCPQSPPPLGVCTDIIKQSSKWHLILQVGRAVQGEHSLQNIIAKLLEDFVASNKEALTCHLKESPPSIFMMAHLWTTWCWTTPSLMMACFTLGKVSIGCSINT